MPNQEFILDDHIIHLNHAAVAPWPKRTVEAVKKFAEENAHIGSQRYLAWIKTETRLREQLRSMLNAKSTDEIALLKSTSEALSVVAYGLDWSSGDEIVIPYQEFPSNRIVWESLKRFGVNIIQVDLMSADSPEQALINAMTDKTKLLSVSSVQYATGLKIHLESLGLACKDRDILFCIDAIQSLGAFPLDVQTCHADFVMADGHKWMLGPEGLAVFYCRQALIDKLQLNQFGWHMIQAVGEFDQIEWQAADNARRFECGSPNTLGIHALHASLELILETGIDTIAARILENTSVILDNLPDRVQCLSPIESQRRSGIVTLLPIDADLEKCYERLQKNNVLCALRGGGIRFSPHYYTGEREILRAVGLLIV
ncbi:MAG: aminotransferase class V-fold PLP-dependent enzyme [Gammaproteobacteria bacterium]